MNVNAFYSTLVISSETLSSEKLTSLFGAAKIFKKNGGVSSKSGSPKQRRSVWSRRSSLPEENSPDAHVAELVAFLEAKTAEIESVRDAIQLDIWCMVSHEKDQCGFSFEAKDLGALAKHGVNLIFDVYR